MGKKLYIFSILLLMIAGCRAINSEIDELYQEIEDLKARQEKVEAGLDAINSSLSTLQGIVAALQTGVYIKSVLPVENGYIISLSNGENYEVHNGTDGENGYSPLISVRADDQGVYYWTLDGDFLLDSEGNKVRADGATPLFDIRDDYWFISYDNGNTWKQLDKATGEDGKPGLPGDEIFQEVKYVPGGNVVEFVLQDGTSITMPCYQAISISFNTADNTTSIASGETVKVEYSLSYGDDGTVVTAFSDGNFIVSIEKYDNVSGAILITCPGLYMDGHVNVMAFDGVGYASIGVITFYEKQMSFGKDLTFDLPTEGGQIDLPVLYNFEYYLEVDEGSSDWLKIIETKAATQSGTISASASKNYGVKRTGYIHIYSSNTVGRPFATIIVNQDAAYFDIDRNSFVFSSAGDSDSTMVTSSLGVSLKISSGSEWLKADVTEVEKDKKYCISLTADQNTTASRRPAQILLYSGDGLYLINAITVIQLASGSDNDMEMVFEVRANEANENTVYLPIIADRWETDCIIDWGDKSYDLINPGKYGENNGKAWHTYSNVAGNGQTFTVTVSGKVDKLDCNWIPYGKRSGLVGVKQWGNTGLTDLSSAFDSYSSLEYISEDKTLAFAEVSNFNWAFARCPRLKTIPSGLFSSAVKALDFEGVFEYCESLSEVPEKLFSNCKYATNFRSIFSHCSSLTSVPENIFEGCEYAKDFGNTFGGCSSLGSIPEALFSSCIDADRFDNTFDGCGRVRTIPEKLFEHNTKASTFDSCFSNMKNLTAIPGNLFKNCPDVYSFSRTFMSCESLKSIPAGLFDNQRKVNNFQETFGWSHNLQGETPYTAIDGKKVHLYERADYPDWFVTPSSHSRCFYATGDLSDKANIPINWIEYEY